MGTGVDFELRRTELAIEQLPRVARNPLPTPTEADMRFITNEIAKRNQQLLIDTDNVANNIEDEIFGNPDLLKSGNTIALTREQLRGVVARSILSGVAITATGVGLALMNQQRTSYLLDLNPLDPVEV